MIEPYYQDELVTLYHGDCREILPQIESVDFIFSDPPYGHNNNNNGDMASRWEAIFEGRKEAYNEEEEFRPIANDGPEANELVRWFFDESFRLLPAGGCCCCCCCGGGPDPQFARWSLWIDESFKNGFKHMIVWDKGPMGMGHHYRRSYETVLVAQKKGAACKWYDDTNSIENVIRPNHGIRKIIPSAEQHPTEKPSKLAGFFIGLHSQIGETVLDPFAGSCTTGVAAKILKRKCILIEQSEKYCEIGANRLNKPIPLFDKT